MYLQRTLLSHMPNSAQDSKFSRTAYLTLSRYICAELEPIALAAPKPCVEYQLVTYTCICSQLRIGSNLYFPPPRGILVLVNCSKMMVILILLYPDVKRVSCDLCRILFMGTGVLVPIWHKMDKIPERIRDI